MRVASAEHRKKENSKEKHFYFDQKNNFVQQDKKIETHLSLVPAWGNGRQWALDTV